MSRTKALKIIDDFMEKFRAVQCNPDRTLAQEITIVIKTFERPVCVAWSLTSIRSYFPTIKVLVCDDSQHPLYEDGHEPLPGVVWLVKPFEDGHTAGAGRNFLIDRVETDFYFLTDDDVQFTAKSELAGMLKFLKDYDYDLVGGTQSSWDYGTATFELEDDILIEKHYAHHGLIAPGFVKCDRVANAFLARHKTVSDVRWEEAINKNTHADFFYRASRAGLKIAQMGRFSMTHKRRCEGCESLREFVFGLWDGHFNKRYRIAQYGGGVNEEEAHKKHKEIYQKVILEKNAISRIEDDRSLTRFINLCLTIGHPFMNFKSKMRKVV